MTDLETEADTETGLAKRTETGQEWVTVCEVSAVGHDRGVAVLVGNTAIAIFRLSAVDGGIEEWCAVSHVDPATGAPVMARGLVGSVGSGPAGFPTVASPLHKQRFNLRTGTCLDDEGLRLRSYPVRVRNALVEVAS